MDCSKEGEPTLLDIGAFAGAAGMPEAPILSETAGACDDLVSPTA